MNSIWKSGCHGRAAFFFSFSCCPVFMLSIRPQEELPDFYQKLYCHGVQYTDLCGMGWSISWCMSAN